MVQIDKRQIFLITHQKITEKQSLIHIWHPPSDIFETDDTFTVKVEIAGMKPEDFKIRFYKDSLSISGYRFGEEREGSYHRMEIPFGEFSTLIKIPGKVDADRINAFYENGFLIISLTKEKQKHIDITEEQNNAR